MNNCILAKNLKKFNKSIESPIVVLDMGINSIYALNKIKELSKSSDIIYLNDIECDNLEGKEIEIIKEHIESLIKRAMRFNPKLLVIINDTLIEYGKELFDALDVNKVYIVDEIIDYVNKNYDTKNMAFLATQGIIESNMYQKNFNYVRLVNLNADNMMDALNYLKMKTSESFSQVKQTMMPLYKKDVDVIIPSLVNTLLFEIEIKEYLADDSKADIIKTDEIIASKVKEVLDIKGKQKNKKYVYLVLKERNKKQEKELYKFYNKVLNIKYKFIYEN